MKPAPARAEGRVTDLATTTRRPADRLFTCVKSSIWCGRRSASTLVS
jgi:hypothetical protein